VCALEVHTPESVRRRDGFEIRRGLPWLRTSVVQFRHSCPMTQQQPATVLLVEDVADTREMYADYLRHCGFNVTTATTGAEALDAAREQTPDLILMDAAMPGLDGWAATKLLKNDPMTRNVPVLILTAHVFSEHRVKAQEVGADGFIGKPCMPDELAREITSALHRWRSTRRSDTDTERRARGRQAMQESQKRISRGRKRPGSNGTGKKEGSV
jgi:two-component system cell cycle response regulator DivK